MLGILCHIKAYRYTSVFSAIFPKGDNFCDFLYASMDDKALFQNGSTLKGMNLLKGSKFIPLTVDFLREGKGGLQK